MSKRTQSIRSMFAAAPDESLSADNKQTLPRVTSGAVKSLKDTFSGVERDYQELREKLSSGMVAINLDPTLIDPSPFADRFSEQDASSFEALKLSLAERGQEIPILVREHPEISGRYQSAYGHRRVRALRELGRPVKAYIRNLSDEELVLAQGIENSTREDLSFIERAIFAVKLESAGFQRSIIQSALSIDRAEASKLIAVGNTVPSDIVEAIGRAPKIGRGRWQALADSIQSPEAVARIRAIMKTHRFKEKESDQRFVVVLSAASQPNSELTSTGRATVIRDESGREIATLSRSARHCRIQIDRSRDAAFAEFIMEKLPDLYAAFTDERSGKE